jgi:hypothetical protein
MAKQRNLQIGPDESSRDRENSRRQNRRSRAKVVESVQDWIQNADKITEAFVKMRQQMLCLGDADYVDRY